jgi:predicted dehydrogenase
MGDVRHVDSVYTYNLRGSFGKILFEKPKHWIHALPGKLFQNVISHAVYNVTDYITDPEPKLRAVGFKLRSQRFGDRRDEFNDELRVLIQGDKCTGHILFSSHIQPSMHWMRLYGTKASLSVNFNARSVTFDPSTTLPGVFGRVALPFKTATAELGNGFRNIRRFIQSDLQFNDGMNRLFRAFYQAILAGQPSPIPMHEAVRVTRILDDIFRQAQ